MSVIFELFGYPLTDRSPTAEDARKKAFCPFMQADCDGGGNRHMSNIDLTDQNNQALADYFDRDGIVPSGVCSLQTQSDQSPWIVCPRRLAFFAKRGGGEQAHQLVSQQKLFDYAQYPVGTMLGVWPELRISYREGEKKFQYTFDYILMPMVLDSPDPDGIPLIIEVMTSSTSGGNKQKGTTIPMAFTDAILARPHVGPGINYRQVWGRMVSQLIVKSEVGLAWGGKTIWILQDKLVAYISQSTALDIRQFAADKTGQVNILSISYGNQHQNQTGIIELHDAELFAGAIAGSDEPPPSFQDMLRAPVKPPKSILLRALSNREPAKIIIVGEGAV